jgi:hypothetical protein
MKTQILTNSETENKVKILSLSARVADLIFAKTEKRRCEKFFECNYIQEQLNAGKFTSTEARGYLICKICLEYPDACDLNKGDRYLSFEEVHERLK